MNAGATVRSLPSPLWIPPQMLVESGPVGSYGPSYPDVSTFPERPPWFEMRTVTESHAEHIVPVTAVLADPSEELIWSGLDNVSTSLCPNTHSSPLFFCSPPSSPLLSSNPFLSGLWVVPPKGRLVSYMSPGLETYSAFRAHKSAVRQLQVDPSGILSISTDTIRHHSRGGLPGFAYRSGPPPSITLRRVSERVPAIVSHPLDIPTLAI